MIEESISKLGPLDTFDKSVFIGNDRYPQKLCNLILSLSLIWNDFKDILLFNDHIRSLQSKMTIDKNIKGNQISPFWGETSGILNHLDKILIALIHELFTLIRNSKDIIELDCFQHILKKLHRNCRESWFIIIKYAFGEADSKSSLGKAFLMVRHKIVNHYDMDELLKGYQIKFINSEELPYVSRGDNIREQRFYFADAAAQEYYRYYQNKVTIDDFYNNIKLINKSIDFAIQNVIITFIQERSAWKRISA